MKALTVRQPWAWCITHAGKDVENRTRNTRHRGTLAIHAGRRYDLESAAAAADLAGRPFDRFHPLAAIVAVVQVVDVDHCARANCSRWALPDHYHWHLADVVPLTQPIPCRGALGLWTVPDDLEALIEEHTR